MQIWFVFSLIFAAIVTLFAVLNADVVTINLFWTNYELSQSLVILMSAALGSAITIFLGIFSRIKSKIKIMELNSQLGIANRKVDLLNKSIDSHEKKADENVPQETEKVDKSSSLE
jgi:lipopolysaccharide assembly protein A